MMKADTIFTGGTILTMDPALPKAEAVAISGGRILAVGTRQEIEELAGPGTKTIHLDGKTMVPGFNDGHSHLLQYGLELATVDMNNFTAGQLMGRHLLELDHRHLAYLSTTLNEQHTSRLRRCQGLETACRTAGGAQLHVFTKDITPDYEISNVDVEYTTGYALAQRCLKEAPEVTAMVAINDMVAYGAYNAICDSGLRVPEDMSLCGFDNIFPSRLQGISLTTIDNSLTECGKSAFHLLQEEIASYESHGRFESITHVEYKCKLIPRHSSGPVPQK